MLVVLFVSMSAYFLAQTIWFQAGLDWSVLKAGLVGVPFAVTTAVCAGFGVTVLAPRIGRRVLQLGAAVLAAGALLTAATVHLADPSTAWWVWLPALVVTGAGFGLMVAPIGMFTIADVPVAKAGAASGLFNTTTQLANAVGVAVLGTLFFGVAERRVPATSAERVRACLRGRAGRGGRPDGGGVRRGAGAPRGGARGAGRARLSGVPGRFPPATPPGWRAVRRLDVPSHEVGGARRG